MALVQPKRVATLQQAQPAQPVQDDGQAQAERQPNPSLRQATPRPVVPRKQWSAPPEEKIPVDEKSNMRFWAQISHTPDEALKDFDNGRFSGSDINPMWRLRKLTEMFGPEGVGWWREERFETINSPGTGGEIVVICFMSLWYVDPLTKEVSKPVKGVGGNMLVAYSSKKKCLVVNDDGFKNAFTDALSICFKGLGGSADIYYEHDTTKYTYASDNLKAEEKANSREKNVAQAKSLSILSNYGQSSPLLPNDVTAVLKALSEEFGAILNGTPDEGMSALMEAQQALVDSGEIPANFSFGDAPVKELAGIIDKIRSYIKAKVATNTNTVKDFFSAKKEA